MLAGSLVILAALPRFLPVGRIERPVEVPVPLCPTCSGDQIIPCPECRGERGDWETGGGVSACETCEGRGALPCPTCDGTGEVPVAPGGQPGERPESGGD